MLATIFLIIAYCLDLLLGDPAYRFHPVRVIGMLLSSVERLIRRVFGGTKLSGSIAVMASVLIVLSGVFVLLAIAYLTHLWFFYILSVYLLYTSIALKDLTVHSENIYNELVIDNNLESARNKLSMIVGRDTRMLSEEKIVTASVESVAENLVDGVTAPLFWAAIFGVLGAFCNGEISIILMVMSAIGYKVINTMDSMWGYKNDNYLNFGWFAARTDDFVNFLPARITGIVVVIAAYTCGYAWKNSYIIFKRDRKKHLSPNAAHAEAAVAGALGIKLGGDSYYNNIKVSKPAIGENIKTISPQKIREANRLIVRASHFFVFLMVLLILTFFIINEYFRIFDSWHQIWSW